MLTSDLDELDEHAVRGSRMEERHKAVHTLAWRAIDELDSLVRKAGERAREIAHLEAQVMHRRPPALGNEARHTRSRVGGLEQLDAGLTLRREHGPDALLGQLSDPHIRTGPSPRTSSRFEPPRHTGGAAVMLFLFQNRSQIERWITPISALASQNTMHHRSETERFCEGDTGAASGRRKVTFLDFTARGHTGQDGEPGRRPGGRSVVGAEQEARCADSQLEGGVAVPFRV